MRPRFTRELTLLARDAQSDGAGGRTDAWQPLGTHWVELRPARGRTERGESFRRSRVPWRITLRAVPSDAPSRPSAGQVFASAGRRFHIRAVAEAGARAEWLVCFADEEVAA